MDLPVSFIGFQPFFYAFYAKKPLEQVTKALQVHRLWACVTPNFISLSHHEPPRVIHGDICMYPYAPDMIREAQNTSWPYTMREVVAITDLISRGDDPQMADWISGK